MGWIAGILQGLALAAKVLFGLDRPAGREVVKTAVKQTEEMTDEERKCIRESLGLEE